MHEKNSEKIQLVEKNSEKIQLVGHIFRLCVYYRMVKNKKKFKLQCYNICFLFYQVIFQT